MMRYALTTFFLMAMLATHATVINVINNNDAGAGSLRQAIIDANGNFGIDTVVFDAVTNGIPIILTSGQLDITGSIVILGNGIDSTMIDGNNSSRILNISTTGVDITVDSLNIQNGTTKAVYYNGNGSAAFKYCLLVNNNTSGNSAGGAIEFRSPSSALSVSNCIFEGNSAYRGGAIALQQGNLRIANCTFTGNQANLNSGEGGAVSIDTGVSIFTNCTFWNNSANRGGAIDELMDAGSAFVNCTFANNSATVDGGALHNSGLFNSPALYDMLNTIVADNTAGGNGADIYSTFGFGGTYSYNIVEDCYTSSSTCPTWFSTADPVFATAGLQDNGGPTPTVALQCISPAIDAGTSVGAPLLDQRGYSRLNSVDIGAYEYWPQASSQNFTICDGDSVSVGTSVYTSTGTYNDTLTDINNCDSIVTTNLTVNTVDTSVTVAGILLTANAGGATYQWYDCDSMMIISGETNQSYTPTFSGNYAVIVTENGCTDTSSCYPITVVGIPDVRPVASLKVYPNPTAGKFRVESLKPACQSGRFGVEKIEVIDVVGRVVYEHQASSIKHQASSIKHQASSIKHQASSIEIDLSSYPAGIYFVRVGEAVRKLVLQ